MKTIKTNPKQSNIFENVVNRFEEKKSLLYLNGTNQYLMKI